MPRTLDPELRRALVERIRFYNALGIYDFYRRETPGPGRVQAPEMLVPGVYVEEITSQNLQPESGEEMSPRKATAAAMPVAVEENIFEVIAPKPEQGVSDPVKALKIIREDLGDCTRCVLHKQGRKQIVFGVGNPAAELMFVGEGPGADEDEQGEPFVGRAGQLLNNMIKAMGIERRQVYIANIVKCRPPGNRTPEREECATCSPFLMRQIAVIKPRVVVALGAVAAKTLLAMNSSMMQLRGRFYDFKPAGVRDPNWDGCKLAVTYHPAFLLRDPRQKGEAWKDLQMVMKELGLKAPAKA
ncbi:MAG: uracil-DNA glycosylase [Acidobacteriales bacterium]|nr:uracil-DNA glycosylase [Candidatus Koribacter versatilis]MBI3645063.1 uracil-DNA glycosylase [Terriglobales bacterium]